MTAIESIRTLELVLFERDSVFVVFHPETLCFFRTNRKAAQLIRDARQGVGDEELLQKYNVTPEQMEQSLTTIVAGIQGRRRTVAAADSGSLLKRNGLLPKAVLMVNNYCNLKCTYCYEHENVFTKKAIDMPLPVARMVIDKVYGAFDGVETWMFIGGEPTLSDDVIDFACTYATEVARQRGVKTPGFGMISNGVRMTDRLFEIIRKFEIQVTFSLDGPKKVNDLVRIRHDNSGSFDAASENILRYGNMFPEKVLVECTVTQAHRDAGLSLPEVLNFCANDLGVEEPHIAVAGLPPGNRLNPYRDEGAVQKDFFAAAEASMDNLLHRADDAPRGGRLDVVAAMVQRLAHRNPKAIMCPAGILQIVVDAFGDIYPCWMFAGNAEHAMGNILRDELRGPKALQVINRIETNSKTHNSVCSTCYARGVCSACVGNNHNSTGRLEDPAPEFCETVRGTLRVVVERLAAAGQSEVAAAASRILGTHEC
jgi:uncharacterized protein